MDKVVHFEIPADDVERAQNFYSNVFGWKMNPIPEMSYCIVHTGPVNDERMPKEPGFINGGIMKKNDCVHSPVVTVSVEEINDAISKVKKAGGYVIKEPYKVGDMGISAYFKDSEGNIIGLWQNLME